MSGFTCGASIIPPPSASDDSAIVNDGWFPDVDAAQLRKDQRVRDIVTPPRLRAAIIGAILSINLDLAEWRLACATDGASTMAAVPSLAIDGESRLVLLYRRAIGCLVRAELLEGYRDIDTTGVGDRKIDALEPSVGDLRRDARNAVRDILGVTRTTVELI